MTKLTKGKPASFISCVLLPIFLVVIIIFSTCIPANIQAKFVANLPAVLWFWFVMTAVICVLIFISAAKIIKNLDS